MCDRDFPTTSLPQAPEGKGRKGGGQEDRNTGRQEDRKTGRQEDRKTGREVGMWKTDRQTGNQ